MTTGLRCGHLPLNVYQQPLTFGQAQTGITDFGELPDRSISVISGLQHRPAGPVSIKHTIQPMPSPQAEHPAGSPATPAMLSIFQRSQEAQYRRRVLEKVAWSGTTLSSPSRQNRRQALTVNHRKSLPSDKEPNHASAG